MQAKTCEALLYIISHKSSLITVFLWDEFGYVSKDLQWTVRSVTKESTIVSYLILPNGLVLCGMQYDLLYGVS